MTPAVAWQRDPEPAAAAVHDLLAADAARAGYRPLARLAAYRRDDWAAEHEDGPLLTDSALSPVDLLLQLVVDAAAAAKLGERMGVPGMALAYQALLAVAGSSAKRWYRWTHTSGRPWAGGPR